MNRRKKQVISQTPASKVNLSLAGLALALSFSPIVSKLNAEALDSFDVFKSRNEVSIQSTRFVPNTFKYNDFKDAYFDNLTHNFGDNSHNSCGYVAIGRLLSYYDTYLNDNIIPEQYDVNSFGSGTDRNERHNSPGVLFDIPDYSMSYEEYLKSVENQSLQSKLISIGKTLNILRDSENIRYGTTYTDRRTILDYYLKNVCGFEKGIDYEYSECSNYESQPYHSKDVLNFAIKEIKLGYPVLLSISGSSGGHVVVAYHYDSLKNTVYYNEGWDEETTHSNLESDIYFDTYKTVLSIHFTLPHKHSDNYVKEYTKYCYDDPRISVGVQECTHPSISSSTYFNTKYHYNICLSCSKKIYETHSYNGRYYDKGHLTGTCTKCGHNVVIS